jgi:hypothetical protein
MELSLRLSDGHPSPQVSNLPYGVAQVFCFLIEIIVQQIHLRNLRATNLLMQSEPHSPPA